MLSVVSLVCVSLAVVLAAPQDINISLTCYNNSQCRQVVIINMINLSTPSTFNTFIILTPMQLVEKFSTKSREERQTKTRRIYVQYFREW